MRKQRSQMAAIITAILLCVLVTFSYIMVGCNKRTEEEDRSPGTEDDIPEPEEPDEDDEPKPETPEEPTPAPQPSDEEKPPENPTQPTAPTTPTAPSVTPPTKPTAPTKPTKPAPTKYSDIVFSEAGKYSTKAVYQDGSITKGKITIRNKTFKGDLTIESSVGSGSVVLENVIVEGTLYIHGGGSTASSNIKLIDFGTYRMVSDRDKHPVRIVADGKTEISSVLVKDDTILEEEKITKGYDGFKNITVKGAKGLSLKLVDLNLNQITTETKCSVDADRRTLITLFNGDAATTITGKGEIEKLVASSNGIEYETKPNKITVEKGVKRPTQIEEEDDNDDDDWDDTKETVRLNSIGDQSTVQGNTVKWNLITNASSIQASSSNRDVATVSVSGSSISVTANKVGKALITVTGSRSGYYSKSFSFTVTVSQNSNKAPEITANWNNEAWYNGDQNISFTVTDKANTGKLNVTINGTGWNPTSIDGTKFTYQFKATERGSYKITVIDGNGNQSACTLTVNIDRNPPEITDIITGAEVDNKKGKIVTITAKDDLSGLKILNVTPNNGNVPVTQASEGTYTFTAAYGTEYTLIAIDQAGNNSPSKMVNLAAPVEPPQPTTDITISEPGVDNKSQWAPSKKVSFTVTAPADAQLTVSVQKVNNAIAMLADEVLTKVNNQYSFTAVETGTYRITASTADKTVTQDVTVAYIDNTPPVIGEVTVTEEPEKQTLTFVVTEDASGINTVTVTPKSGEKVSAAPQDGLYTVTLNLTESADVTICALNGAGLKTKKTVRVSIAPKKPEAPVIENVNLSTTAPTNGNVEIAFQVSDGDSSQLAVAVNGITVSPAADGLYRYIASENGSYTITAQEDQKNKAAEKVVEIKNIDRTAPAVTLTAQLNGTLTADIQISAADENGVKEALYGAQSIQLNGEGAGQFTVQNNGTYTVTVRDQAGNEATEQIDITGLDDTAPMIDSVTVEKSDVYAQFKNITFHVSDEESGVVSVTVNDVPVQINEAGQYIYTAKAGGTYTIKATDAAGNTQSVQQTVSKIDNVAPAPPILKNGDTIIEPRTENDTEIPAFSEGKKTFAIEVKQKAHADNTVSCQYVFAASVNEQTVWQTLTDNLLVLNPPDSGEAVTHTFYLRTIDLAGNVSVPQKYEILINAK